MANRTWTYADLTLAAERQITSSMERVNIARSKGDNHSARTFGNFAWGAFCFWDSLTVGWQNDGDSARLQALMEGRRG